jgi:hypothetical protein
LLMWLTVPMRSEVAMPVIVKPVGDGTDAVGAACSTQVRYRGMTSCNRCHPSRILSTDDIAHAVSLFLDLSESHEQTTPASPPIRPSCSLNYGCCFV